MTLAGRLLGVSLAIGGIAAATASYRRKLAGAAVMWAPSRASVVSTSSLTARVLGESGPPVVLLHGLVASGVYWGATYDRLADGHRLVVPDLLGFGGSPRPACGYGPDDHVEAVRSCLDDLGITEPAVIGAHSLGALIALRLAASHPDRVAAIVAFGPPLYPDAPAARAHIASTGPMGRLFILPGPVAERACQWMCNHRATATELARLLHPSLPHPIAADAMQHTWMSYSQTLQRVILSADARNWLDDVRCPVQLIAGDEDPVVDNSFLRRLGADHANFDVAVWPGHHDLPLAAAATCADVIAAAAAAAAVRTPAL